jgi:hypothetical protein
MILIIILKIIITIFINNDINFLKLDLSLIYMVYIDIVFFHVYTLYKFEQNKGCFRSY